MSDPHVYEYKGERGDKYYWSTKLGITPQSFYSRVLKNRQDPLRFPTEWVFELQGRTLTRDVDKKLLKYEVHESGCWVWVGNRSDDGYGRVRVDGKKRRAHIVSYERVNGAVPEGRMVCHRCGNPLCINPAHLYAGTYEDNYADMVRHGRANRPKGEAIHTAKLTPELVRAIRQAKGSNRELAKQFNIGKSTIQTIQSGIAWRHVK